jgi:hypothetical protein
MALFITGIRMEMEFASVGLSAAASNFGNGVISALCINN